MNYVENGCESCLADLFYYDPSQKKYAALQKGLKEYQFLLMNASLAAKSLLNGDLEKFDALVGENACQVRAIRIALIASKNLDGFRDLAQQISDITKKIDDLLLPSSINQLMMHGSSLKEIIDHNDLHVKLTSDQMFVIQSYILSEMKETQSDQEFIKTLFMQEKIVPGKLKVSNPQISSSFMDRLASRLRKLLSKDSVDFVRQSASFLNDQASMEMVSQNFGLQYNGLMCVPMFWSYKVLLALAYREKIPLIYHVKFLSKLARGYRVVDEDFLFFKPCPYTHQYVVCSPTEEDLKLPVCVIQGVAASKGSQFVFSVLGWRDQLLKHPIIDVILAGAADHRQYPNPEQQLSVHNQEYENYKKLATKHGFSLNNPTTFFIQHVYSAQAGKKLLPAAHIHEFANVFSSHTSALNF